MDTKNHFLLIMAMLGVISTASGQNFGWAKSMGGREADYGRAIAVDDSGNVYTTGSFQETVDFDPDSGVFNLTAVGFDDIFVSKLDAFGRLVWAVRMGGSSFEFGNGIALGGDGNVYVVGAFEGTADFDPGPLSTNLTAAGATDLFISKLDPAGNLIWAKRIGGNGSDVANAIVIDNMGNLYLTGSFRETVDFNPDGGLFELSTAGRQEVFVLKLDNTGSFVWARRFGGDDDAEGFAIAVDGLQNVYTTGGFEGKVDFNPGGGMNELTSAGETYPDIFICCLNVSGNFVWARNIGDIDDDYGRGIAVDDTGNVYVTGEFRGTADFGGSPGLGRLNSGGGTSNFILKLNQFGAFQWANQFGAGPGNGIALDASSNVYTIGSFSGAVDFDPGLGSYFLPFQQGVYVSKLDAGGEFISALGFEANSGATGFAITLGGAEEVYTTGIFNDTVDFDPDSLRAFDLTSAGGNDVFVTKFQPFALGVSPGLFSHQVSIFPNPVTSYLTVKSEARLIGSDFALLDQMGRMILSGQLAPENTRIDLKDLPGGIYLLLLGQERKQGFRIIKQ